MASRWNARLLPSGTARMGGTMGATGFTASLWVPSESPTCIVHAVIGAVAAKSHAARDIVRNFEIFMESSVGVADQRLLGLVFTARPLRSSGRLVPPKDRYSSESD